QGRAWDATPAGTANKISMTLGRGQPGDERIRRRRRRQQRAAGVVEFLEYLAPPSLAVPEEPYGLQVGAPTSEIRTIVVAPGASFNALSMAASRKQSLLVTAAPLLTKPLMSVRRDDPVGGRLAYLLE